MANVNVESIKCTGERNDEPCQRPAKLVVSVDGKPGKLFCNSHAMESIRETARPVKAQAAKGKQQAK